MLLMRHIIQRGIFKMIGKRFGRLVVFRYAGYVNKNKYFWCRCDCGRIKRVRKGHLISGAVKSCGCYNSEKARNMMKKNRIGMTHGMSKTRLYRIWMAMKRRCGVIGHNGDKNYGGRGIIVCENWKNDFVCFKDWALNHGYQDGLTIDRIDVNGNYCPENCRWITNDEQQNNRRNNHIIEYDGKKYTLAQASRFFGIPQSTLWGRLKKGRGIFN